MRDCFVFFLFFFYFFFEMGWIVIQLQTYVCFHLKRVKVVIAEYNPTANSNPFLNTTPLQNWFFYFPHVFYVALHLYKDPQRSSPHLLLIRLCPPPANSNNHLPSLHRLTLASTTNNHYYFRPPMTITTSNHLWQHHHQF